MSRESAAFRRLFEIAVFRAPWHLFTSLVNSVAEPSFGPTGSISFVLCFVRYGVVWHLKLNVGMSNLHRILVPGRVPFSFLQAGFLSALSSSPEIIYLLFSSSSLIINIYAVVRTLQSIQQIPPDGLVRAPGAGSSSPEYWRTVVVVYGRAAYCRPVAGGLQFYEGMLRRECRIRLHLVR